LLSAKNARPLVDSVHPFEQLPAAFARLEAGPMGKVLLRVGAAS
jgi:NADPH:quinone reductase-like Zn-dependent oxidoreductase